MDNSNIDDFLSKLSRSDLYIVIKHADLMLKNINIVKSWDYDIFNLADCFGDIINSDTINSYFIYESYWSNRTIHILKSKNIKSLRELNKFSSSDILKWKGVGKKVIEEINKKFVTFELDWDYE